jgi:hypothetical protein
MIFFLLLQLIDFPRRAARRAEMNRAKPIEPPCDGQRIFQMKNFVHTPTLWHGEETN